MSRYRVLHPIGSGGMGEVFLAEDRELERKVALKFLPEERRAHASALARFDREARAAAALDHPYICKIYEVGRDEDGRNFIAMEYVSGQTLAEKLASGAMSIPEALRAAVEISEAMETAHGKRILHRDLKPANIMLTEHGHVKLMDFGLAKRWAEAETPGSEALTPSAPVTQENVVVGTPAYMSPEQLQGSDPDGRSDVFSFGIVLYEMLTGVHPFLRATSVATAAAILHEPHPRPRERGGKLPASVEALLEKTLAKRPDERYASFGALREELSRTIDALERGLPTRGVDAARAARGVRLVGRDAEWQALAEHVERARNGQGALVLLGGEPGVGKTRLAEEVLAAARGRGLHVYKGRCYEMEGAPAFIPFVEILEAAARLVPRDAFRDTLGYAAPEVAKLIPELRRLYDDIPPAVELPAEQQRRYLFNSVFDFLERACRARPHLLLLDDLQWADESTLLLLEHIVGRLERLPLLMMGTYRDTELEVENARPFPKTLEELLRRRLAESLRIKRLSEGEVSELLLALSGQAPPESFLRAVFEETEGNPFFVEELFRHLAEENELYDAEGRFRPDVSRDTWQVPEGVRLVIERRLQRVSESCRKTLSVAAVAGRDVTVELLEAVGEGSIDDLLDVLEEAERARLVNGHAVGRETRYAFQHALIQHTLQSQLSAARKKRLHHRIGEGMEKLHATELDEHASELAQHFYLAGSFSDREKTLDYLLLAGEQALTATASGEALRFFDMAEELLAPEDDARRARYLFRRGLALRGVGRWDESIASWHEAFPLFEKLDDTWAVAHIGKELSLVLAWSGRWAEIDQLCERAYHTVRDERSRERGILIVYQAMSVAALGDYERGLRLTREVREISQALGDRALEGMSWFYAAIIHSMYGEGRELRETAERAVELLRDTTELWDSVPALTWLQCGHVMCGRFEEALAIHPEMERMAERIGHLGALLFGNRYRALADFGNTANFDALEAAARHDLESFRSLSMPWSVDALVLLGMVRFWRGEWEDALSLFRDALEEEHHYTFAGTSAGALFRALAYLGDPGALRVLEERSRLLPQSDQPALAGAWKLLLGSVEGLSLLGETERAGALYPRVLGLLSRTSHFTLWDWNLIQKVAGIGAAAARKWDASETHFETALQQAASLPHRIEQQEVRRWYAHMLLERNAPADRDKGGRLLEEAAAGYESLAMPRHRALVIDMSRHA